MSDLNTSIQQTILLRRTTSMLFYFQSNQKRALRLFINTTVIYHNLYFFFFANLSVPIRRGPGITWTYGQTGDERLFETDYEEIVFETDSKWQNIKIAKSREFGNVLLLDNDIMLGESDLVYTETLLGLGRNEFKDKTILILGGGDGGILHEILKMSPAYVLMAEVRVKLK